MTIIHQHLLEYQFQSERRANSWLVTPAMVQTAYSVAVRGAPAATGLPKTVFLPTSPYTLRRITDDDFPPSASQPETPDRAG